MSLWVYTGLQVYEEFDIYDESRPLKMNVFNWRLWFSWRLWKWRNWCDHADLIFMRGLWSMKTFVFVVSFSLSWVIGNTVLLKGVEVKLRKSFQVMLISKSYTYPILSSEAIGNLIQFSQFLQWQIRSSSGLWGICSDWGVRNSPVRIAYQVRNMIALRNLIVKFPTVAVLCASCPKISTHLTVISLKGIYVLSCRAAP